MFHLGTYFLNDQVSPCQFFLQSLSVTIESDVWKSYDLSAMVSVDFIYHFLSFEL